MEQSKSYRTTFRRWHSVSQSWKSQYTRMADQLKQALRRSTDNVSLKLWCENGDFGFFLASTPAKHKAIKESEPVFNSNEEKTTELHQSSPKQARQTRKRKKVCSTQVSPELLRESSTNHVSDTSINITEISIPCQNNFQALSEAGEGSDDADEEVDDNDD